MFRVTLICNRQDLRYGYRERLGSRGRLGLGLLGAEAKLLTLKRNISRANGVIEKASILPR